MAKQTLPLEIEHLRPVTPTYTIKPYIWSATISASNMRIILI